MKDKIESNLKHNSDEDNLTVSIGRLLMKFTQRERSPREYGEAGFLTPTEIHTIDAIGCGAGIIMGELASRLGVTRSAATQMIRRLEGKKFVKRTPNEKDFRVITVVLTDKGVLAYKAHEDLYQKFCRNISKNLNLTPKEIEMFKVFVDKLYDALDE